MQTLVKLVEAIEDQRGIGTGDNYKPWIKITRKLSSPYSNLNLVTAPNLKRLMHFLSRGEREFAYFMWWIGAVDIREQYPLWPWPHVHPLAQISQAAQNIYHPGMRMVAELAGIRLRKYPKSDIPLVLTLDMLVTVPSELNVKRLIGISCKPLAIIQNAEPTNRELERLELDRRYCLAGEIPFRLAHPELESKKLMTKLHAIAPIETRASLDDFTKSKNYQKYIDLIEVSAYDRPAWIASNEAAEIVNWSEETARRALKIAIWHQHIDADIEKFSSIKPLVCGGRSVREINQKKWFGEP